MSDKKSNNKRLAKNTLFLYFRMILLIIITLYTSRVTLQVLGVEDFGIYNIVGGVVVLFAFLSRSLNSASSRYLSVAVGSGDEIEIQKTFSTALVAHLFLMLVVFLLLQTVGLWFVVYELNIPEDRVFVSYIIYQFAVLSTCLNIVRIPFNASIIANEQMNFYAYTSIVEGLLKLFIVWILLIIPIDKLVSYSILMMLTIGIINLWYILYCRNKFLGNRLILKTDKEHLRPMLAFSGWNLFGGIADIGYQQGTNIILNIFYGVTLNTAMGITNQVKSAVYSFVGNLQMAAIPQIYKSYANKEHIQFQFLIFSVSKYSFFLMLFFSIPLIINMDFILELWLKNVPEYAEIFTVLILIYSTLTSMGGPLWSAVQATGDVRVYSLVISVILLLNLPVTYVLFMQGCSPESMLYARITICMVAYIWQLLYAHHKVAINIKRYMIEVLLPIMTVALISSILPYYACSSIDGWTRLLMSGFVSVLTLGVTIYIFGLTKDEREYIKKIVSSQISKFS